MKDNMKNSHKQKTSVLPIPTEFNSISRARHVKFDVLLKENFTEIKGNSDSTINSNKINDQQDHR
jgi:hypothetical protein